MSKPRQKVQAESSLFWVSLRLDTDNIDVWNYITVYLRYAGSGVDQPLLSYNRLLRATLQITRRLAKEDQWPFFFARWGRAPPAPPSGSASELWYEYGPFARWCDVACHDQISNALTQSFLDQTLREYSGALLVRRAAKSTQRCNTQSEGLSRKKWDNVNTLKCECPGDYDDGAIVHVCGRIKEKVMKVLSGAEVDFFFFIRRWTFRTKCRKKVTEQKCEVLEDLKKEWCSGWNCFEIGTDARPN